MAIEFLTLVVGVVFAILLWIGLRQMARGANSSVANGAVALVVAAIAGVWFLGLLVSWEGR